MENDEDKASDVSSAWAEDLAKPLGIGDRERIEQVEEEDEGPDITPEKLDRVRRKLGLVRLSWPPIELDDDEYLKLPNSYSTVSEIEKVLLWHAENFRRQYHAIYPNRKPLLLTCANECGVQKFVSSSIRRTLLPYAELSTWQGCASFVSDFLTYAPPKEALLMALLLLGVACIREELHKDKVMKEVVSFSCGLIFMLMGWSSVGRIFIIRFIIFGVIFVLAYVCVAFILFIWKECCRSFMKHLLKQTSETKPEGTK